MEDFDFENKKIQFDFKNLREGGISLWTRILLRIWPLRGVMRLSRELGVNPDFGEKAHKIFTRSKRIDIVPLESGTRGFQLIIDGSAAFYFYQNNDHFEYDGFEIGEYKKGDVTIFDDIQR